ncbi:MAG: pyrroloquinoline quinone biosynthesis protein PqqB [Paracoccaceae bacterium]
MQIVVLGAGAGGGLPQWNCGCANCVAARAGQIPSMTQSSVAVSADGACWAVFNASPDIGAQLARTPALHPQSLRGTPIHSVLLTNADIDHIAGLLTLREKTPFAVRATQDVLDTLEANSVFKVLDRDLVSRDAITLEQPVEVAPSLQVTPFSVPGKVALFLEGDEVKLQELGEQTIGLIVDDGAKRLAYVPGCAVIPDWLVDRLGDVDALLFDGTVWNNDDMQRTGTGKKTGARMGHIPMNGAQGSLERLADVPARKIYIHINNTNPILDPGSPERADILRAGWDIAYDGMELTL